MADLLGGLGGGLEGVASGLGGDANGLGGMPGAGGEMSNGDKLGAYMGSSAGQHNAETADQKAMMAASAQQAPDMSQPMGLGAQMALMNNIGNGQRQQQQQQQPQIRAGLLSYGLGSQMMGMNNRLGGGRRELY